MPMPANLPIKKYLPLVIAAAAGLIAVALINVYIQQQSEAARQKAISGERNLATAVIAKSDIAAGTAIKEEMVKEVSVNRGVLQPRAAQSIDRVVDKVSLAPISKGEQIMLNKLAISGQELSLSSKIPSGKRAITVPVDNISSVGGMIKPGDHVDVLGNVPIPVVSQDGKQMTQITTMPLFQNVLVLAVGQEFTSLPAGASDRKETRTSFPVITLALSPQEANLIAFAQEQGKIRFLLRSPGDTQVQPTAPASWEVLYRTALPQAFKEEPVQQAKPEKTVEIYRGANRESTSIK
ncbi:MAG: Flp pilus assembly protein CpaB [Candidatus Omnitrophota bacterium]|nr:Flp pilus assembly protein CpaB [Candidatus Omnitrophota bacterium]